MKTRSNFEKELFFKQMRVAYWEKFGSLPNQETTMEVVDY